MNFESLLHSVVDLYFFVFAVCLCNRSYILSKAGQVRCPKAISNLLKLYECGSLFIDFHANVWLSADQSVVAEVNRRSKQLILEPGECCLLVDITSKMVAPCCPMLSHSCSRLLFDSCGLVGSRHLLWKALRTPSASSLCLGAFFSWRRAACPDSCFRPSFA